MSAEARAEPGAVSSVGPGFGRAAGLRWCGRLALVAVLVALNTASAADERPAGQGPAAERLRRGVLGGGEHLANLQL